MANEMTPEQLVEVLKAEILVLKKDKEKMSNANVKQVEDATVTIEKLQRQLDDTVEQVQYFKEKIQDGSDNMCELSKFQIDALKFVNGLVNDEINKVFYEHRVDRDDSSPNLVAINNVMLDLQKLSKSLLSSSVGSGRVVGISKSTMSRLFCKLVDAEAIKLQQQINEAAVGTGAQV